VSRFASSFDNLQPDLLYLVRHALPVFVDMVFPFLIPYYFIGICLGLHPVLIICSLIFLPQYGIIG